MALPRNYSKRGQIHHKVAMVLKACDGPVAVSDIKSIFLGTPLEKNVVERLHTQIWNIKEDHGDIKTVKNGRIILTYELVNRDQFSDDGRFVG
jgi:hypothetical protein